MSSAHCVNEVAIVRSPRVMQLEGLFDLPPTETSRQEWSIDLPVDARPWNLGLIVGPSGSGKSTIARNLFADSLVSGYDWPSDRSLVDAFPDTMPIDEITGLLSSVGFSSPPSWLRPFACLSNGEQFRVTLARALAESPDLAVIDEFTSVVDRTVAKVGSAAVAKLIRRRKSRFVAVSCHYDIVEWLDPDWVFDLQERQFHWRSERQRPPLRLDVSRVHRKAWDIFQQHHYLSTKLHRSAQCFLGSVDGRPAVFTAVIGFPHPHRPGMREHRTVCLPDFQGLGLGSRMSEFVASLYRTRGYRFFSTSGHPAVIAHRRRAKGLWIMRRAPGLVHDGRAGTKMKATRSTNRVTAGFEYVGPAAPAHVSRGLLTLRQDVYVPSKAGSQIVQVLKETPGLSKREIARRANVSGACVDQTIDRLIRCGAVDRTGPRRQSRYAFIGEPVID